MNIVIRIIIIVLIGLGTYGIANQMIKSKEKAKSKKIEKVVPLVDVVERSVGEYQLEVESFGTVRSYFETSLTPEVSGQITSVSPSFRVGEMVAEGEILVTIDSSNFETTVARAEANLILMQSALDEEKVRAAQAKGDWLASGRKLATASNFVLRKPQMAAAEANIKVAQVDIKRALLDLERTKIRAPYAAIVTARSASLGNFVTSQNGLGILVATDKAEVRIPLTPAQMQQVAFSSGDKSELILKDPNNDELEWPAELDRMEPVVDAQNQVNYGIATIEQPYTNEVGVLSIGTFVNVILPSSKKISGYKLPESALVNDKYVWLVDEKMKLVRADAERIHTDGVSLYVEVDKGDLSDPLRVVSRPLSNFRNGVEVKTSEEKSEKMTEEKKSAKSNN